MIGHPIFGDFTLIRLRRQILMTPCLTLLRAIRTNMAADGGAVVDADAADAATADVAFAFAFALLCYCF